VFLNRNSRFHSDNIDPIYFKFLEQYSTALLWVVKRVEFNFADSMAVFLQIYQHIVTLRTKNEEMFGLARRYLGVIIDNMPFCDLSEDANIEAAGSFMDLFNRKNYYLESICDFMACLAEQLPFFPLQSFKACLLRIVENHKIPLVCNNPTLKDIFNTITLQQDNLVDLLTC
jgi:hypothetical protein